MLVVLQVAVVQEYKNTQTKFNQLSELQLPTLKVANVKSLSPKGRNLHIFPGYLSTTLRLSHLVFPPLLHLATCTHSLSLQLYTHSTPNSLPSLCLLHSVYWFICTQFISSAALCLFFHMCTLSIFSPAHSPQLPALFPLFSPFTLNIFTCIVYTSPISTNFLDSLCTFPSRFHSTIALFLPVH